MRRRQWVREGDLIVIQPWEFQDEKANVCMRYTKTQSLYLSRKGVLPEIVDLFGMSPDDEMPEMDDSVDEPQPEEAPPDEEEEAEKSSEAMADEDDDIDSFFG